MKQPVITYPILNNVDSRGRVRPTTYPDGIQTFDDLLGLPRPRRAYGPPSHALGYEWAVSERYQNLVYEAVCQAPWASDVCRFAKRLMFPNEDVSTDIYQGFIQRNQGIARVVEDAAPEFIAAITPFARQHGLDALPWGLGWLIQNIPPLPNNEPAIQIELPEIPLVEYHRKPMQGQRDDFLDALQLYLWLTGAWRDPDVQKVLEPIMCFSCKVDKSPHCDRICWSEGSFRPDSLQRHVARIKKALGIHRPPGRPSRSRYSGLAPIVFDYLQVWGSHLTL